MVTTKLAKLLLAIQQEATYLLIETMLNDVQRTFLQAIDDEARALVQLFVSLPPEEAAESGNARMIEVMHYEARSHLSSIIGYAEMLLDEVDGSLLNDQKQRIHTIRAAGKNVLRALPEMPENESE